MKKENKKAKKSSIVWSLIIVIMAGFVIGCNEDEVDPPANDDVTEVADETTIESSFDEVEDLAFASIFATSNLGGRYEEDGRLVCAIVSKDTTLTGELVITIDFGSGCQGPNGRTRKGVVKVTHDGKIWQFGSTVTVELVDFYIDGVKIEGTRKVINKTTLSSTGIIHEITLSAGRVIWTDGSEATREVSKVRTWIRDNTNPLNDVVQLTGSGSGINRKGVQYTMTITEALVMKRSCWADKVFIPVSGIKEITTPRALVTVNFGDGTCDKTILITVNGKAKSVELN
ncbi:MAG: hypothetical protein OEX02_13460 [Cyclobacteriaceae bacterium]|nr:hypothetical protein [Cyclobacteriaceae bacterium]